MENLQKIKIENKEYLIVDSIQDLRAEDSFIHRKNKLEMYVGSGEARKYVGSYASESGQRLSDFFEYFDWGNVKVNGVRTYPIIQENNCFFSKSNLLKYLYAAEIEYQTQEQVYNFDISESYNKHLEKINALQDEKIFFSVYDVSDFADNKSNRGYIRSDDAIWELWRRIVLPKISYLSILKLIPIIEDQATKKPLYYFRILLDYQFRSIVHPSLLVLKESETTKIPTKEKDKAFRLGQEKYRREVIDHMAQCPFSKITDERLLIASHIKPYNICIKENRKDQALDYLNGLALTPTYDKLFDQGYITFTDEGFLVCGTLLTPYTWDKLNINPNAKNKMKIFPENREEYLDFHRQHVFQDNINDLI